MAYSDLNAIHNPATGTAPPATWGDQVALNDDYLYLRGPYICTAATRPGAPFEGQLIYQTDTNTYLSFDGGSWWTVSRARSTSDATYTPTVTQLGAIAKTVTVGEYSICNGWCDFTFLLDLTAGGSGSNIVTVSIPVTALAAGARPAGVGMIYDDTIPLRYSGFWALNSTTTVAFVTTNVNSTNYFGVDPVNGLTSGCALWGHLRYRIASAA